MPHKTELQARALVLQLRAPQAPGFRRKVRLLIEAGYGTIARLRAATDEELEAVRNVGKGTVKQIRKYLAALEG